MRIHTKKNIIRPLLSPGGGTPNIILYVVLYFLYCLNLGGLPHNKGWCFKMFLWMNPNMFNSKANTNTFTLLLHDPREEINLFYPKT